MKWSEVLADPTLQDLPYKIELNEWGQIVMTPASNLHGWFQAQIIGILTKITPEKSAIISECSIQTSKGVKVADIVWASEEFMKNYRTQTPYPVAPEVCVEILSPSNTEDEIQEKIDLYLAKGAQEVWTCDLNGNIKFYNHSGRIPQSRLFPNFPREISTT